MKRTCDICWKTACTCNWSVCDCWYNATQLWKIEKEKKESLIINEDTLFIWCTYKTSWARAKCTKCGWYKFYDKSLPCPSEKSDE